MGFCLFVQVFLREHWALDVRPSVSANASLSSKVHFSALEPNKSFNNVVISYLEQIKHIASVAQSSRALSKFWDQVRSLVILNTSQ